MWRTLGTDHSYWYGLDMNSGRRTEWIEGSHEGCGKPPIFLTPNGAWYDSQDHQVKDLSSLLDMTHKSNDLRKCLLGYDSPRNKTSSYKEQKVLTPKIQTKIDYFISWLLDLIYRITSCRDPKKNVLKTRHKKPKTKTWLNKVFDWNLDCLLI